MKVKKLFKFEFILISPWGIKFGWRTYWKNYATKKRRDQAFETLQKRNYAHIKFRKLRYE